MSQAPPDDPVSPLSTPTPTPTPPTRSVLRSIGLGLTLTALAVVSAYLFAEARTLWREYSALNRQLNWIQATRVVGYPGITPRIEKAQRPDDWYHHEGGATLLWGGWRQGVGHRWFRVGRGEIDRRKISEPIGRDSARAIDVPVVEQGGGTYWARIPDEALVAGQSLGGVETAYPMLVLMKVMVVNDTIAERPFLVVANPLPGASGQVAVYDPVVDGERISLGSSGYFHDGKPLLYDRGTESLWVEHDGGLRAIAGAQKGRTLPRLANPATVTWSRWRADHPHSRLVVGADRTRDQPRL
jgi:hypothetical protein